MTDPFRRFRDLLPPGSVPVAMAGVIEYLDANARNCFAILHGGDMPLSTFVGLLELAKRGVIDEFEAGQS